MRGLTSRGLGRAVGVSWRGGLRRLCGWDSQKLSRNPVSHGATESASRRCAMTTTQEGPNSPAITWGYRRKSSLQQSYERQTKALHDLRIPEGRVFEDAMSGKTMNRPG